MKTTTTIINLFCFVFLTNIGLINAQQHPFSNQSQLCTTPSIQTLKNNEKCRRGNGDASVYCLNTQIQIPIWSNGAQGLTVGNLQAGIYTVTVTSLDGCTATATAEIANQGELFSLTLTPQAATCEAQNGFVFVTTSATSNLQFAWSDGSNNTSLQNITSGTYSVTLTNAEGCNAIKSTFVDNIGNLPNTTAVIHHDFCSANSGSISFVNNPTNTYIWSNGATTGSINNLSEGVYSVTITNANCSNSTSVSIVATPMPIVTITPAVATCNDNDVALVAGFNGSASAYIWNNGSTADTLKHAFSGIYTVTATDFFGCTATATYEVVTTTPQPFELMASKDTIYLGETVTLSVHSNIYQPEYYWFPINNTTNTVSLQPTATETYSVATTNALGCSEASERKVVVLPVDFNIPNVFTPNGDGENDFFYVISNAPIKILDFKIYNRWGNLLFEQAQGQVKDYKNDGWNGNFNEIPQPTDTYLYTLSIKTFDGKIHKRKGDILLVR